MKLNKSLGGRIAHLEVPTSRKFLNPPNKPKSKKRECQTKQFIITRPSMRGFFDWWKFVSVWSISHFGLSSFLVLYIERFLLLIFMDFLPNKFSGEYVTVAKCSSDEKIRWRTGPLMKGDVGEKIGGEKNRWRMGLWWKLQHQKNYHFLSGFPRKTASPQHT